jgi:hypothetical protein
MNGKKDDIYILLKYWKIQRNNLKYILSHWCGHNWCLNVSVNICHVTNYPEIYSFICIKLHSCLTYLIASNKSLAMLPKILNILNLLTSGKNQYLYLIGIFNFLIRSMLCKQVQSNILFQYRLTNFTESCCLFDRTLLIFRIWLNQRSQLMCNKDHRSFRTYATRYT